MTDEISVTVVWYWKDWRKHQLTQSLANLFFFPVNKPLHYFFAQSHIMRTLTWVCGPLHTHTHARFLSLYLCSGLNISVYCKGLGSAMSVKRKTQMNEQEMTSGEKVQSRTQSESMLKLSGATGVLWDDQTIKVNMCEKLWCGNTNDMVPPAWTSMKTKNWKHLN